MPTGKLREGYMRIAGVVRIQVMEELLHFMEERRLASRSKALGEALQEWYRTRRTGLVSGRGSNGVLNPAGAQAKGPHSQGASAEDGTGCL